MGGGGPPRQRHPAHTAARAPALRRRSPRRVPLHGTKGCAGGRRRPAASSIVAQAAPAPAAQAAGAAGAGGGGGGRRDRQRAGRHRDAQCALPVLNGMVYTKETHQRAVLTPSGLRALLGVLCDAVPPSLHEQASHVLMNATSLREHPAALRVAIAEGAVGAMQRAARAAHLRGKGGFDGLSLAYSALSNLVEGCPAEAGDAFVRAVDAIELLVRVCGGTSVPPPNADVKLAASALLLALCSTATSDSTRQQMVRAGAKRALESVSSAGGGSNEVIAAKAKQALRALA